MLGCRRSAYVTENVKFTDDLVLLSDDENKIVVLNWKTMINRVRK
jgi:hypothetical protein